MLILGQDQTENLRIVFNEYQQLIQYLCRTIKSVGISINETDVVGQYVSSPIAGMIKLTSSVL
jgi:hypothetical protein